MKLRLCLALLALAGAGCRVGPKYVPPTTQAPPAFKELPPAGADGGWKPAKPGDELPKGKWWEVFNDPQLNQLEERVNLANPNLRIAEANYRQALAAVKSARAGLFPTVSVGPGLTTQQPSQNRSAVLTQGSTFTTYQLLGSVAYEPDLWGRVRNSIEGNKALAQASEADLENVRLTLQTELASNYFQLLAADSQQQLLNDTVTAFERALQLTNSRYQGGIASRADVEQAKTQLETTRAQSVDVAAARAQLEHAIAVLVGEPVSNFGLKSKLLATAPPPIPVALPSELLERRPDIAALERRVAAVNASIGIAESAWYPVLTLTGQAGFQSVAFTRWFEWPSHLWAVGPALAQTVFDGGARKANLESVRASYDAAIASYRATVLTAFQEVEDSLSNLRILDHESEVQQRATESAQKSLDLALQQYKGGIQSYLQVVTAQSTLLNNQRQLVSLLQRRMVASVSLVKAVGGSYHR